MYTKVCGGRKCCPKLHVYKSDKIVIEDDYNNKSTMTKKQAVALAIRILSQSNCDWKE